jgi:C1A family cysteine protease
VSRLIEGCKADPADATGTHTLAAVMGLSRTYHKTLDLTHLIRRVREQGKAGTCVGFGVGRACENAALQGGHDKFEETAALQIYKQARALQGRLDHTADGTTSAAALEGLERGGFLYESEMPYDPSKRWGGMKLGEGQTGLRRAGVKSHRITEVPGPAMKQAIMETLSSGKGVCGGWKVGEGFEKWKAHMGAFDGEGSGKKVGHSMCVLDYPAGLPRLVNSWGPDEGAEGLWVVSWEWLMSAMAIWAVDFVPAS